MTLTPTVSPSSCGPRSRPSPVPDQPYASRRQLGHEACQVDHLAQLDNAAVVTPHDFDLAHRDGLSSRRLREAVPGFGPCPCQPCTDPVAVGEDLVDCRFKVGEPSAERRVQLLHSSDGWLSRRSSGGLFKVGCEYLSEGLRPAYASPLVDEPPVKRDVLCFGHLRPSFPCAA